MMNSENNGPLDREELLEQLFDRALQQPSAERKNWVVSACDGDGELTQELIDLVCAHDAAPDCLDAPPWSPGGMLVADSDELSLGSTIGPYVVGRLLGEGGMGSVYLAEQCEPLRRQVALKVIKLGMDTREVLARFDAERQLLARLSHPHVAAVHDAGATPRGRPYFVMEWVDGEPITSFCDRLRLNVDDRLALFEKVCDAVQHAHQQGVMHRDLKPGNILVSESAGHAVPKVIDFGVAKAVGSDSRLETSCTRIGQQIGTPGYMSPEQASPDQVVDTRTDVYSLGALLHELLVGALPRDAKKLGQLNPEGLARELVDTEVVSPSRCLSALGAAGKRHAARRDADLGGLLRRLRGDLNWIVLKALATDPEQRYASASELAADVSNSLAGLPVNAGPPAFFYRARRLATAHKSAAALCGAVLMSSMFGAYITGQEVERSAADVSSPTAAETLVSAVSPCVACDSESAAVHDTVLVSNGSAQPLVVGDLVELLGETRLGDAMVMTVVPARADSGHAPLGPVSTAAAEVPAEQGHIHGVSGTIAPGGLGRVVVRGTLALLAVDDSGGAIRANASLVVGASAARAAASVDGQSIIVGTALQDWAGPGEGLIRAYIAPRWEPEAPALLAVNDRSEGPAPQPYGGGGNGGDQTSVELHDGTRGITDPSSSPPKKDKLLPSSMPTSSGTRGLQGTAAALRSAPRVSILKDGSLENHILTGGTLGGNGGPGLGGTTGHPSEDEGAGQLRAPSRPETVPRDEQVWGDMNGDDLEDLILTVRGKTTVLANHGQGRFVDRSVWSGLVDGFVGSLLTLSDVDGDGDLDLLSLDGDGRLQLHEGEGDGRFFDSTVSAGLDELPPLSDMAVVDPEGDGSPDLQLTARDGSLLFLLNDGRATFTASVLRKKAELPEVGAGLSSSAVGGTDIVTIIETAVEEEPGAVRNGSSTGLPGSGL